MRILTATFVLLTITFSMSVAISAEEIARASDKLLPPSPIQSAELALFKLGQVNEAVIALNSIPAPESCSRSQVSVPRAVPQKSIAVCMSASDKTDMKTFNVTSFEAEIDDGFRIKKSSIEVSSGSGTRRLERELEILFGEEIKLDPAFRDAAESTCRGVLQTELKRMMKGDLSSFRCKVIPTERAGSASESKRSLEEQFATGISATPPVGGIFANPWIQLDGFQKNLGRSFSPLETETTVRISTPAKISGANVKPFIGVTRTKDALDRKNQSILNGLKEAQFAVGVTMEWK